MSFAQSQTPVGLLARAPQRPNTASDGLTIVPLPPLKTMATITTYGSSAATPLNDVHGC
ncbi:hypothetical protein BC567DRAFT_221813 [Phyllosticta citribraziliensis]